MGLEVKFLGPGLLLMGALKGILVCVGVYTGTGKGGPEFLPEGYEIYSMNPKP